MGIKLNDREVISRQNCSGMLVGPEAVLIVLRTTSDATDRVGDVSWYERWRRPRRRLPPARGREAAGEAENDATSFERTKEGNGTLMNKSPSQAWGPFRWLC